MTCSYFFFKREPVLVLQRWMPQLCFTLERFFKRTLLGMDTPVVYQAVNKGTSLEGVLKNQRHLPGTEDAW